MPTASEMPTSRVDWVVEARRTALLIHDMQDYFLDFYDCTKSPIPSLLASCKRLRDRCMELDVPIFYSRQPPGQKLSERGLLNDMWGPGLAARTEGGQIVASLAPAPEHTVLAKHRYSAFHRTPLLERLRGAGRSQIMICGIYGHIGCLLTACDAFMHDVQPFMAADAIADFSRQEHEMTMDYIAGRCGVVASVDALVSDLGS